MTRRTTRKASEPLDPGAIPWMLAIALASAAPHAAHLPAWLSAAGAAALLWRAWLWHDNRPLPRRWLLVLAVVAGTAGIGWEYRTLFGRDSGVALLFFFMLLKPMEMQRRRDALALIMLGFFLLLTHYLYSQEIATGLWLLCSTGLLIAGLIRLHGGAQPFAALMRYALVLLLQASPFMLILFLLFPRVEGPLWGLPRDAHAGLTGLSDHMSPGSLNELIQSGDIAFRVRFSGPPPENSRLYWRGPVLVDYDGQTWRARPFFARPDSSRSIPGLENQGRITRYTMTIEPHNQRWLLALDLPTRVPDTAVITPLFEARSRLPLTQRTRLEFASATDSSVNREENAAILQQALRLPPRLNPGARDLAAGWRAQLESPERISAAALSLFRDEKFFYTLHPPLLGPNAVDDFLFRTRRGFCEHFATAYVFLMRAAGIPARVVAGYQGGEINPIDGYFTVRQSDAHAWAEIWISGKGWLRVDPTGAVAPSRIERGIVAALPERDPLPGLMRINSDWLRDLRFRWEAFNNAWNQWVLGYNQERQREVLSQLGFGNPDWRRMTAALAALCAAALLAVSVWTLRRKGRESPAQRLWRRYCERLRRHGIERAPWEGPLALAERVGREYPGLGPLTRQAADDYALLHYGAGGDEELERLKTSVQQLERWKP